jgi:hypothetical protein
MGGAQAAEIMTAMGHRQLSTVQRYIHFAESTKQALAERAALVALEGVGCNPGELHRPTGGQLVESERAERAIEHVCELLGSHMRDWWSETNGPMIATLLKSGLLTDSLAGLPIVSPEGLKVVLRIKDETEFDEQEATRLIDDARNGDYAARFVLCDLAAWRLEAQQELPTKLREYIVEVLRSVAENHDNRRGRDRYAYTVAITT